VRRVDEIPASDIVRAYAEIGLDVAGLLGDLPSVVIYRCGDTGYRFYYPHSLAATEEFYTLLQEVLPYYAEWRWEHGETLKYLQDGGRLLEIGAGSGNFLARVAAERPLVVEGLELNEPALRLARERGLRVEARRIEDFAAGDKAAFDIVCSFQVLEHVPNVASFVRAALDVLKVGGKLILGVPNCNPYLFKYDRLHALNLPPHHMGLWDKESLAALESVFPLRLLHMQIEPLAEVDHFYEAYLRHIERARPLLHLLLARWPWRARKYLYRYLQRAVEGRNLLAVFEKRAT
jgi:2-polyprenyl-3-methyl-5-hydroxy-6-metoxy-1,4-benzoquinol methylase